MTKAPIRRLISRFSSCSEARRFKESKSEPFAATSADDSNLQQPVVAERQFRLAEHHTSVSAGSKFCLEYGASAVPKAICIESNSKLPSTAPSHIEPVLLAAVEQGNAKSQPNLDSMYLHGSGVPVSSELGISNRFKVGLI